MTAGFAPLPAGGSGSIVSIAVQEEVQRRQAADISIRVHFAGGYTVTEKTELWCAMRVLPGSGCWRLWYRRSHVKLVISASTSRPLQVIFPTVYNVGNLLNVRNWIIHGILPSNVATWKIFFSDLYDKRTGSN
jgi:hypothetical protein